jgi:hypothetical protein
MAKGIHCDRHLYRAASRDDDALDARERAWRHPARFIVGKFFGVRCELSFSDFGSRQCTWTIPLSLGFCVRGHGRVPRAHRGSDIGLVRLGIMLTKCWADSDQACL